MSVDMIIGRKEGMTQVFDDEGRLGRGGKILLELLRVPGVEVTAVKERDVDVTVRHRDAGR